MKRTLSKLLVLALASALMMTAFTGCRREEETTEPTPTPDTTIVQEVDQEVVFYDDKEINPEYAERYNQELPEFIEVNGYKYKLQYDTIDYSEEGMRKAVQKIVELRDVSPEDIEKIAKTGEFEVNGRKYTLTRDYIEKEVVVGEYTFNEEVVYENQSAGTPKIPASKEMSYVSPITNEVVKVEGKLKSKEITDTGEWVNDFVVDTKFVADSEAAPNYTLHGTDFTIPYNASAPTWTGYQADIIRALGLSKDNYKITSAKWDGGFVKENDKVVRYGTYSGSRRDVTYTATYEAPGERLVTNVKVYYRTYIDETMNVPEEDITSVYGIKVTAKYVLVKD